MTSVEDLQKLARDTAATTLRTTAALSQGVQAIIAELADGSKTSFADGSEVLARLAGATSLDEVVEIQTDYALHAWEGFVARATRMGTLYADLGHTLIAPFEVPPAPGK